MTYVQTAAVAAAILIAGVSAFQLALAAGLPLGEATLGGSASTVDGVLTGAFRILAAGSALILVGVAWIVLARVGIVGSGPMADGFLTVATWVILGFLALNTVGNLAAPHPVERWVMGSITLVVVTLVSIVALRAP